MRCAGPESTPIGVSLETMHDARWKTGSCAVPPEKLGVFDMETMDRSREDLDRHFRKVYPRLVLDVVFTGDRRWAIPTAGRESGFDRESVDG